MATSVHENHPHQHGANCGHPAIEHQGHVDYLHDGHLHHQRADGKVEEHKLAVGAPIQVHARRTINVADIPPGTCMDPIAGIPLFRTATTSTTSSTAICTIRTVLTATTTAP